MSDAIRPDTREQKILFEDIQNRNIPGLKKDAVKTDKILVPSAHDGTVKR